MHTVALRTESTLLSNIIQPILTPLVQVYIYVFTTKVLPTWLNKVILFFMYIDSNDMNSVYQL